MQLSEALQKFILQYINSVEQLEILLLLKQDPAKQYSSEDIARLLFTHKDSVEARLNHLTANGLAETVAASEPVLYRYAPRTAELDNAVKELARDYPAYRVSIINLIFSKPIDRIRTFADAFRFTKPDKADEEEK
jgi:hypothetical protein